MEFTTFYKQGYESSFIWNFSNFLIYNNHNRYSSRELSSYKSDIDKFTRTILQTYFHLNGKVLEISLKSAALSCHSNNTGFHFDNDSLRNNDFFTAVDGLHGWKNNVGILMIFRENIRVQNA